MTAAKLKKSSDKAGEEKGDSKMEEVTEDAKVTVEGEKVTI